MEIIMTLIEKAAYIKGLAEGLKLDKESAEGKLINALIDIVSDIAAAQNETDEDLEYLNDCDCDCDDESFEITCPNPECGETIVFDGEVDPEDLVCPACGEKLVCECED